MLWYWYVGRANEILLDLDSKKAVARTLGVLRRAMKRGALPVESVYFYPSLRNYHVVVVLRGDLDPVLRALWALWMGSDRIRGVYVIERIRRGVKAADVLSTPQWFEHREPDDYCRCSDKHKDKRVTDRCPAMLRLLGEHRSGDYFPRNFDKKKRQAVKLPWGKVSKQFILEN